ncbi:endonuclease/exonuclease/phosphatase family protein [Epibacterium sp. Ofav1-8]|uniref:endonuclease/exonuclease/phosphatase family protein n=1 Tax=Epibacterium sp. Ofav1-8 TaxID=2917735 RepID=UPI001EF61183|nr:endonuclease/exonuclease/phosphatase family protein [Epibacterium sp. Ofav1-8]MCG7625953.1 endonuclease/exonuclease/phosphatase family protein [Epibacterium sp. Ofav1-8]
MLTFLLVASFCVMVMAGCVVSNRFYTPPEISEAPVQNGAAATELATGQLSLITWNIGYAGMGRESDFVFDLGEQKRPLNAGLVDKNLSGILEQLSTMTADVLFLQEVAKPSYSTYQKDLLSPLRTTLLDHAYVFGADVDTRFVPPPLKVQVGNVIFSKLKIASAEWRALPLEPDFQLGLFRKNYRMHIVRLAGTEGWTLINIHLSTFDGPENSVREKQVEALFEFAKQEYQLGRRVIIGGDWNLKLADTEFPSTTDDKYKFWIRDFPMSKIPDGWSLGVDPDHPTVRTAYKPYVAGENYTLIIDGFLVSPNVKILDTQTTNLGFEDTDHHPVRGLFKAR